MKCRVCSSLMIVDHCETSGGATTCWHRCPVCRQVRLFCEPDSPRQVATSAAPATVTRLHARAVDDQHEEAPVERATVRRVAAEPAWSRRASDRAPTTEVKSAPELRIVPDT